ADARIAAGAMRDDRQLDAAGALVAHDAKGPPFDLIYGEGGVTDVLPAIARPLAAGDEARVEWGIETTASAFRRAASLLSEP
ncbi:MAG: hypothetical protein KGM44_03720, partial [bacterium]|nr:hypothetical protein [bacterium]